MNRSLRNDGERRAALGQVGIVVCDGEEVDEACERRGCARKCAAVSEEGHKEEARRRRVHHSTCGRYAGSFVQCTCVIDFLDDLWQQADGVDAFQIRGGEV